ncbi:MAG: substrate-binding domain-containing protein [Pleomorphochaeta sp.]
MKNNIVTAIFCVNELTASIIIQAAKLLKRSIPNDISIMGFDHIQFEDIQNPNLSSIAQNFDQIAKKAVELLIKRIKNPKNKISDNIIVPTKLYKGKTVKTI